LDTHTTLLNRRSIRKYLKDEVSPELLEKIMTAAIWAPSGSNSQPWRFYVATGAKRDELIQAMIEATGPDAPSVEAYDEMVGGIEEEGLKMLGKADTSETGLRQMGEEVQKFARFGSIRFYQAPVAIIVATPKSMSGSSHQSIGAAVQNILLAAHAEGLATCWLGMPLMYRDKIIEVLDIPEDEVLVTSVCLGYPDTESSINKMDRVRLPYDQTVHFLS
jgi:nitroreductase